MRTKKPLLVVLFMFFNGSAVAQNMTLQQVIQQVMDHYPAIKSAAMQVEKAQHENIKVESQLSWLLNSNLGIHVIRVYSEQQRIATILLVVLIEILIMVAT